MQTLAWGTIVTLVLLLPGFCFFPGLYAPERFSRDLTPRNPLGSLASIVLVALLTHAWLAVAFQWWGTPVLWDRVLQALLLSPAGGKEGSAVPAKVLAAYYREDSIRIPAYLFLACLCGWIKGLAVGNMAVRGFFPFLTQHPWASALYRDEAAYAYILSDVEHGENVLLYQGRLLHFGLTADGAFSYVMLKSTNQGFLRLGGTAPKAGEFERIGRPMRKEAVTPHPGRRRNRLLAAVGLGRVELDFESGAILSIAASNMRDVVLQTYRAPEGALPPSTGIARYQRLLKLLDFYTGRVDGVDGPLTAAAIKGFQTEMGVRDETGIGPRTRALLDDLSHGLPDTAEAGSGTSG